MLKVQEFLRSGGTLAQLEEQYGIKSRVHDFFKVVCLNYDQINSPMGEEIVHECRALILELGTWNILSWPFKKFFNVGEGHVPADFDWDNFTAFDKLDGSLIHIWRHPRYGWQIATRSVPDADCPFDDSETTFKTLVIDTLLEMGLGWDILTSHLTPGFCYTFELTAPENQVVVMYEKRTLTLTGVRNLETLEETLPSEWLKEHHTLAIPCAKEYHGWSKEFAAMQVSSLNPREAEGYVLLDSHWNRAKIKSEAYCFMSNSRDALGKSNRARLELILSEKDDDVLPVLPVFVQKKILALKTELHAFVRTLEHSYTRIADIEDQKEFAMQATQYRYSGFLFSMRKTKMSALEICKQTTPQKLLEFLSFSED